jgi:uncharacterized protein with HEPN domain
MSKRTSKLLLEDIIESAEKILHYTKGISFEEFSKDNKTDDAVIRNFEIIGEASNLLPDKIKDKFPLHLCVPFRPYCDFLIAVCAPLKN